MNISQNQVRHGQKSVSKLAAITKAGEVLLENGFIEEEYIASMLKKEESDITYIGNGIAIPHGLNEDKKYVKTSGISVIHYPQGIKYDDNEAFIIIGIAGEDSVHLEILQELAIKLSDEEYVKELIETQTLDSFIEIFNQ